VQFGAARAAMLDRCFVAEVVVTFIAAPRGGMGVAM
jgi:hypothetical protein